MSVFLRLLLGWLSFSTLLSPFPFLQAAEPPGWQDLGLYGGQINAIAIDPVEPDTMFAGSYYGDGLFKSTNGGVSWQSVEGFRNEAVFSISFDPRSHRTIWVASFCYILKSEDGGSTWGKKLRWWDNNRYFYSLAIDPLNSNTLYAGATGPDGSYDDARVFKTIDGGETWQETSLIADHTVVDLALNPQNSQEVWAVTYSAYPSEGSIYQSLDGGATWWKINTGYEEGWFNEIEINPQDPRIIVVGGEKGLYITKDGGVNWNLWEVEGLNCRALAFDPQNPDNIYATWGNYFSKSTDGGIAGHTILFLL